MNRHLIIAVLLLFILKEGKAQIRLSTLTVSYKEVYEIRGTDIMVVDTLVLADSARILLNPLKKDNFIHAKKMIVGKGSMIDGRGLAGIRGKTGGHGFSSGGPCRDGTNGQRGTAGSDGKDGSNLFMYVDELKINGNLIIDLTGGDGGDGGKGGHGGDGNMGTRVCQGGNGGAGGNGSAGGNGGSGGNLTITSKYGADLRPWLGEKIKVRMYGGYAGQGGEGGLGGQRGLGSGKDGAQGKRGVAGTEGKVGKEGAIFFEKK
jgi:hypothetical protein